MPCLSSLVHGGRKAMTWIRSRASAYAWPLVLTISLVLAATLPQNGPPPMASDQGQGILPEAVNVSSDPNTLETFLVAMDAPVDLGNGVVATAITFNGIVPGPLFRLQVGNKVIVHFTNNASIPLSIHWHGVELTNRSDGTGITQDAVQPGGTFVYDFIVPRQGIFFYHSHIMPTNPEFKGFYGPIVVEDPNEQALIAAKVLPNKGNTRTLIIGDTTVCKEPGSNDTETFPNKASLPWVGNVGGAPPLPADPQGRKPVDECEAPLDEHGHFVTPAVALPAGAIPNIQPTPDCGTGTEPGCPTSEGQLVLTNGRVAAARAGTPDAPGALAADASVINVKAGEGIRLQLGSAATIRYLRLRLTNQNGGQVTLFRVGGQGGLLDNVRVEGGTQGTLDTLYQPGEILLPVASREDVVFVVPDGAQGDVLTLWTLDFKRCGAGSPGFCNLPTVPVAHFKIVGAANKKDRFTIAADDPLRTHPAVANPIESLKLLSVNALLDSTLFTPPQPGSNDPTIRLSVGGHQGINGTSNPILDEGATPPDSFTTLAHVSESRWAVVGDVLELTIFNDSNGHHPWHPHGFSIQPVRFIDAATNTTVFTHDYNEFVDVVDIPSHTKLVYRVRLDDRPFDFSTPTGGAIGRWAMHCHIFFHAAIGMITELVA